jgi:hypothetical protein
MIARVFARRTKATPVDELAFYDDPPLFLDERITEIHVSITFTDDRGRAEYLAKSWSRLGLPVYMGGPGMGEAGHAFVPGRYPRPGYVITSRGCDRRCPHCFAWRREGDVRELAVKDGWNVLDDNLLACSELHIRTVFAMLKRQQRRAEFTGGLEAARLKDWHVHLLRDLNPEQIFFAYDTPDDHEPLVQAGKMLLSSGFTQTSHTLRCYVLIGYPGDSMGKAERRLRQTLEAGFTPMAMLYRDEWGIVDREWQRFQRKWARPSIIYARR